MSDNINELSVTEQIYNCLNLNEPKSFFLFAGAGSGKTRTLVEVLKRFKEERIEFLRKTGKKVAVITYTNAACDVIKGRLEYDLFFYVSTIHSFAWELIKPYTHDIRASLIRSLSTDISELNEEQSRARGTNSKSYIDRASKIESKTKRISNLPNIKKFTYNPNGENNSRDSLSHSEVINIAAEFINNLPLMRDILVQKYPILLIDESQDTKKELVDAFFKIQKDHAEAFILGMFGDTMQRIYSDGKVDLQENIPDSWAKPAIIENYRCPTRVVELINIIRSTADNQKQVSKKESEGILRMFIVNLHSITNKHLVESNISRYMSEITEDKEWKSSVKVLTLEHHMAANRGGFSDFFVPLYNIDKLKTGLLDGTLSGVSFFINQVLPLVTAKKASDEFALCKVLKKYSPLLSKDVMKNSENPKNNMQLLSDSVAKLYSLWDKGCDPTLSDILKVIYKEKIYQIPDVLLPIAQRLIMDKEFTEYDDKTDDVINAWESALMCLFSGFEKYVEYISDESIFGTHQGIKGREFPRVMAVLDDEEARGFLFKYDKMLGAEPLSKTDIQNIQEGKDSTISRTQRLFYVICSRAEESLAIVAYTKAPENMKEFVIANKLLHEEEIILVNGEDF